MNDQDYITSKKASSLLGVTSQTLRLWAKQNKIRTIRTLSNQRMYHQQDLQHYMYGNPFHSQKERIVYARVSSKKQMDDLKRQSDFLRRECPDHILVTDIGSGVNWKRKGLQTILEGAIQGRISEVVVAHRDRLCRFAFELLDFLFHSLGVELIVLDKEEGKSNEQELTDDIISIIHIFSCRNMGRRRYSTNQKNPVVSHQGATSEIKTMDGDHQIHL